MNNLSNRQWLFIGLIGIFLISLIYNIKLSPALERQQRLKQRHHIVLTKLQELNQYQIYQRQLQEDTAGIEEQIRLIEQVLPERFDLANITAYLLQAIQKSELQLIRQVMTPEFDLEHYAELSIHLQTEGYYRQLLEMVRQLEKLPFLVNIRRLEIKNNRLTSDDPRLQIQIDLSIYRRQPNIELF